MIVDLNGFSLELSLLASRDGAWITLPVEKTSDGFRADHDGVRANVAFGEQQSDSIAWTIRLDSAFRTRLRLRLSLPHEQDLFHLIPGNIFGDNNAPHVRAGQFPCLTEARPAEKNCSPLWEFRADRASHPVSMLACRRGAVGVMIDPYSPCDDADGGFIRNGVFAALPDAFGVSLGYGNDPLTFSDKTNFLPATADLSQSALANGVIYAIAGNGRAEVHRIIRKIYDKLHDRAVHQKTYQQALRALADSFIQVNWSPQLQQYTNRKCQVAAKPWEGEAPAEPLLHHSPGSAGASPSRIGMPELAPWRAIVEIGWTGGSMLAYPFALAEHIFPDLKFPKSSTQLLDEICGGFNEASGFLNDTTLNRLTKNRPADWNASDINGWWSGFLPQTRDNHCAYTNAHAAYYLLRTAWVMNQWSGSERGNWIRTAIRVLDTAIDLQREDGAFGYIFSSTEKKVIDYDGFAGCWFVPALVYAWKLTARDRYLQSAIKAITFYRNAVRDLVCSGTPMDTYKSIDSEGNLAFIRAARLLHEFTNDSEYLQMLAEGANFEYLWRYAYRTRPQCAPLKDSQWNSCGGSITSVSNPHIHPMSVVATEDLAYLSRTSGDEYHQSRADDGLAWVMNTLELYPNTTGYGRYGVLSERTCPSDGLLSERYADGSAASTWWSYNAWAAGSAMEAIAERIMATDQNERGNR